MNLRLLALLTFSVLIAACDRSRRTDNPVADRSREEQRIADETYRAELRDVERRAAEREAAAREAETDLERAKIAEERASLEREKQRLLAEQRRIEEKRRSDEKAAADDAVREAGKQARVEQTLEFFYEALDPHGDWIEVERYGYCWRPAATRNSRWRPYMDGHWAWTDYGWTWVANEPFGWATYHYGRWTRLKRLGWVWVPGSEWAPAWVAWRRSDQHVGWAPLPPDAHSGSGFTAAVDSYYDIGPGSYAFVDVQDFGEPTYVGRVVEPEQNVTIINMTVNVTNITYRNVENKTVVFNGGPEINVINERSRKPLRAVRLERVSDPKAGGSMDAKENVLRLAAPEIVSAAKLSKPPRKVSERVKAGEVDHGWQEADEPARQKVRAQHTAEAKRAEEAQRTPQSRRAERGEPRAPRSADDQRSPEPVTPQEAATPSAAQPKASPSSNATAPESRANQQEQADRKALNKEQPVAADAAREAEIPRRGARPNDELPANAVPREPTPDAAPPRQPPQQPAPDADDRARRRDADRRPGPALRGARPKQQPASPAPKAASTPAVKPPRTAATPPPGSASPTIPNDVSTAPSAAPVAADASLGVPATTPVATPAPAVKRKNPSRQSEGRN